MKSISTSLKAFRTHRAVLTRCLACLVVLAAIPAIASARPGDLDPSFGRDGKVTRPASLGRDAISTDVAALPKGGAVVLAGRTLFGFRADGSIARGFSGGSVRVADPTGEDLQLLDLAVDSRGRILVAGGLGSGLDSSESPERVFVARFTRRGQPDPSFGANGVVVTDLGLPGRKLTTDSFAPTPRVRATGIAIDPADRVVLTGTRLAAIGPCRGTVNLSYLEAYVARLDPSGRPDGSFGKAGVVSLTEGPELANDVRGLNPPVVDQDGKVYLSTQLGPCQEGQSPLVGRLDSSGRADPSFGDGGWVRASSAPIVSGFRPVSIALDPSGRLLLLGQRHISTAKPVGRRDASGRTIAMVKRWLPSGTLDPGFGRRGIASTSSFSGGLSVADLAVDGGARVWVAGTSGASFFVGRFTSEGQPDRHFGRSGRLTTGFGNRSEAVAGSVITDARGRALLAGTLASSRVRGGEGLALARYLGRR